MFIWRKQPDIGIFIALGETKNPNVVDYEFIVSIAKNSLHYTKFSQISWMWVRPISNVKSVLQ